MHVHPDRHFFPDQPLPANVHQFRKSRQQFRSTINIHDDVDVVDSPDFPLLLGLFDGKLTAEEEEAWEREKWMKGHDVDEMARQMVEISQ
jgi:N-glycosylase/DNA lyase